MQSGVAVVGGGPAGIATAIAASLRGFRATVLDFRTPPIDKSCGEGLLPGAVEALRGLGVDVASVAYPFSGIRFSDEQSGVGARIAARAYGLRRTLLHELLVKRATELGVRFLWGARVSEFGSNNLIADGQSISFRWLVGADGQNSAVRKWAGLDSRRSPRSRFGFCRHYAIKPWSDFVEVFWGERCQVFVTPTGAEEVCVALLTSDSRMRIERALAELPALEIHLRGARPVTSEVGAVNILAPARAVTRGNVALVGDASCAIDGIAGQGLSLAFEQAFALGDALASENLASYAAAHRRITASAIKMTRLLLLLDSSVLLRRKALRLFAENPSLFSRLMTAHAGDSGSEMLHAREVAGLGWRILWA